jgi:hypothetical protein
LSANATYHFRIVAANPSGSSNGSDETFTTGSPPEYGRCKKLAKGVRGAYSTGTCTVAATAEKYSYEWLPGPGPKRGFTSKLKELTAAVIETVGGRQIVCNGESGSGEFAGRKTLANVRITFTGCEMGGGKCASSGAGEGELVTNTLTASLGIQKAAPEGPLKDKIASDLFSASGPVPVIELNCGLMRVSITGSVLDPVPSNRMMAKATLKYSGTAGIQKPEGFEGLPRDVLEAAFGEGPAERAALKLAVIQTNEEPIEINSIV